MDTRYCCSVLPSLLFHFDIPLIRLYLQNCAAVNIPMAQIQAFSSKPLGPIKLESFVVYLSRSRLREPNISGAVPFDLSASKAARTHCSEATTQRISTDIQKYAFSTNNSTTPNLIGFTPADIESLHSNLDTLNLALSQLGSLIKALNGLMEFDRMSLGNLMARGTGLFCNNYFMISRLTYESICCGSSGYCDKR